MTEQANLERELQTYALQRASLSCEEGRFVVISGETVQGIYDTYKDALSAGYANFKLTPFLVKQINAVEVVANFSRRLKVA